MEDTAIVQLYWDRDERAISATSEKYGGNCAAIAANILGDRADAEECVNDTYLRAWNAMPPHKPRILSTFLGKIVRNLSLNRWRQNTAEKRGGGVLPAVLDEVAEVVSGVEDVEQKVEETALISAINDFLSQLSPEKRSMFICRYWRTDSVADIAARCEAVTRTLPPLELTSGRSSSRPRARISSSPRYSRSVASSPVP